MNPNIANTSHSLSSHGFLFAGFIDHKTSQPALDHALSLQTSSVTSDCHPLPSYCWRFPFPASTPNWQTGLEHDLCAAAIPGTRSKHLWKYRSIKLVSPLSGAFTDFLIFKSFYLSCFYDEEVRICLLCWKWNRICANSEVEIGERWR